MYSTLVVVSYLLICSAGCSQQTSLERKLAVTKEYEVDYFQGFAKTLPSEDILVLISERLSAAFDEITKANSRLEKPHLVIVVLGSHIPDETVDRDVSIFVHIEWFEYRYVPHFVQFTNTNTMESWVYDFQCDWQNNANGRARGVRLMLRHQFGRQASETPFIAVEEGMKLLELARTGNLKAVLVNDEGTALSNEVLVDFHERRFSVDDLPSWD